jgi:hypothetical protein
MSVASLNNGSLQLSELVISNEKYSNATGYVASSSTFSAGVTGTSLSVSGSIDAGTTLIVGNESVISAISGGGLSFQSGTGPLECGDITAKGSIILGPLSQTTELESLTGGLSIASGNGSLACGAITCIGNVSMTGEITLGPTGQPTLLQSVDGGLSIASGNGSLSCGGITSLGGATFPGTITLGLTGVSGVLSCNSGGQLLWNTTVIA